MRALTVLLTLAVVSLAAPITAQEGHPLKGSWIGTWGPSKTHSNDLLVMMNWDGKTITGMINPGTDNIPIKNATLNPEGWVVHLEAEARTRPGRSTTCSTAKSRISRSTTARLPARGRASARAASSRSAGSSDDQHQR